MSRAAPGCATGFDSLRLAAYEADLDEGEGHRGRAALIDLVARKPG